MENDREQNEVIVMESDKRNGKHKKHKRRWNRNRLKVIAGFVGGVLTTIAFSTIMVMKDEASKK